MSWRHCQLRVRDPDVFLLLPATPLAHRHAHILRTIPVDHTIFCFTVPRLAPRAARPLLYCVLFVVAVANIFNLGADIGAMGAAMQLLLPKTAGIFTVVFGVG